MFFLFFFFFFYNRNTARQVYFYLLFYNPNCLSLSLSAINGPVPLPVSVRSPRISAGSHFPRLLRSCSWRTLALWQKNWNSHACQTVQACACLREHACVPTGTGAVVWIFLARVVDTLLLLTLLLLHLLNSGCNYLRWPLFQKSFLSNTMFIIYFSLILIYY